MRLSFQEVRRRWVVIEAQGMLLRRVKRLEAYQFHDDETKQQLACLKSTAATVVRQFTDTIPLIEITKTIENVVLKFRPNII